MAAAAGAADSGCRPPPRPDFNGGSVSQCQTFALDDQKGSLTGQFVSFKNISYEWLSQAEYQDALEPS